MAGAAFDIDAVVVGSGPNGLVAAIRLAQAGCSVVVLESARRPGGGARSAEVTLPGFIHDLGSAVHPLAAASPALAAMPLASHGLEWVHPDAPAAHPLDHGPAAVLERSLKGTAAGLGSDNPAWQRLFDPLVRRWDHVRDAVLGPVLRIPDHPVTMARFGLRALPPARVLWRQRFRAEPARALFAGMAAHSALDLARPLTSAFGLVLAAAGHTVGWPAPRGGAQSITTALVAVLESLGGEVRCDHGVRTLADLPRARATLFDLTPRQVLTIAGDRLPWLYRKRLARFAYGPGAFKVDYALDGPVPWSDDSCRLAGTVHLGGTAEEVASAERDVARGRHPERPFVLCAQPSLFDGSRAPAGRHTLWAYCHVPNGSTVDMTAAVERQIERFAPGFADRVLARRSSSPAELERMNANLVGGDVAGGSHGGLQLVARPVLARDPYRLPVRDMDTGMHMFMCSASTPPGAGVHGMCGWWAARSAVGRMA